MTSEGMYHLKAKEENEIRFELKIKCSNLNSKIKESSIRVAEQDEGQLLYDIVYSTEVIKSKSEASYEKTVVVDYYPQKKKKLVFQLFSGDGKKKKHVGEFKVLSSTILSEPGHTVRGDIVDNDGKIQGKLEVFHREIRNTYKISLLHVEIKDLVSCKSEPYFKLYNQSTLIHVSEVPTEKSTKFLHLILPLEIFNGGDMDRDLKVEVYDRKNDDELIGITHFKTDQLVDKKNFPLINPNKISKSPGYQNSGHFFISLFQITEKKTKSQIEAEREQLVFENNQKV